MTRGRGRGSPRRRPRRGFKTKRALPDSDPKKHSSRKDLKAVAPELERPSMEEALLEARSEVMENRGYCHRIDEIVYVENGLCRRYPRDAVCPGCYFNRRRWWLDD